jgi:hypothetical protein
MKFPRALWLVFTGAACLLVVESGVGQEAGSSAASAQEQVPSQPPATQPGTSATGAPLRLTLQDALDRARKNSTQFQAAVTNAGLAREDKRQAFTAQEQRLRRQPDCRWSLLRTTRCTNT